ncbi:hypothetical protein [Kribbella sp. CA-247076]|uniref:hypothetical protein n=1 Tax=Kribbella sp. CA-247076 TaxID=3239941 RepID=UPI003D8DBDB6
MADWVWRCGKCDGAASVPAHHRLCPLRDPGDVVDQVVVVWPPFGEPDDPWLRRLRERRGRRGDASGTAD